MMNEITLKARLADADPNAIEKVLTGAAGGNLRERFIPGYANKKYGQAGVEQANQNAKTGADSLTRNTQETNRNALGQRQVDAGKPVSNFNPAEKRPIGIRQQQGDQSDIQHAANANNALQAANQGQTAQLTPLQPMGGEAPGENKSTIHADKKTTTETQDGDGNTIDSTVKTSNVVPQVETTEPEAEVPSQPDLPPPSPAAMGIPGPAASPQPQSALPASPQPSAGAPPPPPPPQPSAGAPPPPPAGGQTNSGTGQQANMGNTFNIGGMGGGQGQGQGQAQQQMTPQQAAKGAQVANATKRSQTKGGLATNALAGVATMGLSNVAGGLYNAYQRNQGNKQLQQLSKMLLIRKSIGIRNTTGALRRGRI